MATEFTNVAPPMPACWRQETKTHKFCPGCGHGIVLKALGEAIDELGIQKDVIFTVDIGCCLLAIDFFNFDTVQTHHAVSYTHLDVYKRQGLHIKQWSYNLYLLKSYYNIEEIYTSISQSPR